MNPKENTQENIPSLVSHKDTLRTGSIIEFSEKHTNLIGYGKIKTEFTLKICESEHYKAVIRTAAKRENFSLNTLAHSVRAIERFFKKSSTPSLNTDNYKKTITLLSASDRKRIDSLFKFWHASAIPGVSTELLHAIDSIPRSRNSRKSNRAQQDKTGYYIDEEYYALLDVYWHDYEEGTASLQNTIVQLLNAQYSRRPIQYAQLKTKDFMLDGETLGVQGRRVLFPGAKDRGAEKFRASKIEVHPMTEDLWILCQLQIQSVTSKYEEILGFRLSNAQIAEMPFLAPPYKKRLKSKRNEVETYAQPEDFFTSELWHMTPAAITKILRCRIGTEILSERSEGKLHEFAYRMRYTRARQLLRMGVSPKIVSYWLGQENLGSLESYVDDPAERARMLEVKLDPLYAPLAQAFTGSIVNTESEAVRGNDPASRIEIDGDVAVGSCGEEGFCSASVPIPCYRCSKFQPWVNGPHEEVLTRLVQRQKEENNFSIPSRARRLLVPLQLDKDIIAVKRVIALCNERKRVSK